MNGNNIIRGTPFEEPKEILENQRVRIRFTSSFHLRIF